MWTGNERGRGSSQAFEIAELPTREGLHPRIVPAGAAELARRYRNGGAATKRGDCLKTARRRVENRRGRGQDPFEGEPVISTYLTYLPMYPVCIDRLAPTSFVLNTSHPDSMYQHP